MVIGPVNEASVPQLSSVLQQTSVRDAGACVVGGCRHPGSPVWLMEARLFLPDDPCPGGLCPNNLACLCEKHRAAFDLDAFPIEAVRRWARIPTVLPKVCPVEQYYDRWGNVIRTSPGSIKYPRTPYLDRVSGREEPTVSWDRFAFRPLIVTAKMDGSCVSLTRTTVAARNGRSADHPSFDLLKAHHAKFRLGIPGGYQLFGEWMFARHSIAYEGGLALPDYFQLFSIYDEKYRLFLEWDEVVGFAKRSGCYHVPVLGSIHDDCGPEAVARIVREKFVAVLAAGHEGVVVRTTYPFHAGEFSEKVGKLVRDDHVQTDKRWARQPIIPNELRRRS